MADNKERIIRKLIRLNHPSTSSSTPSSTPSPSFRLVCYNVLAPKFVSPFSYPLQFDIRPGAMTHKYRLNNLLKEIEEYEPDIVCLQECQDDNFIEFWKPAFNALGFSDIYLLNNCNGIPNHGLATFYLNSKFVLEKNYPLKYSEWIKPILDQISNVYQRVSAKSTLAKEQVGLATILKSVTPGSDGRLLCVANTHLVSNKTIPETKVYQVMKFLEGLERVSTLQIPILLCGDFNADSDSVPVEFILERALSPERLEVADKNKYLVRQKLTHQVHLDSVYPLPKPGKVGELTSTIVRPDYQFLKYHRNDYIFFSGDLLRLESHLDDKEMHLLKLGEFFPSERVMMVANVIMVVGAAKCWLLSW